MKGENAEKKGHPGKEYWSRRPYSGIGRGKALKVMTHRQERRIADREVRQELNVTD